ncbi:MAG: plastocyanin/azurin family copper-binding protein [Haloplanus sp.]
MDDRLSRRTVLRASGLAIAGAAGCTGTGSGDGAARSTPAPTDEGTDGVSGHEDSGDGHQHGEAVGSPADHTTVTMRTTSDGYYFDPHVAWISPGGTITWKVASGTHTTTAYHSTHYEPLRMPEGATPWDSGMLTEPGATFEHTFETEGVYDYFCTPHESMGMLGSVVVGKPDPEDQPGLAAPQNPLPARAKTKLEELNAEVRETLG